MRRIKKLFISGLLAIIPIALTFFLLYYIISSADRILRGPITSLLGTYIPGLGFIALVVIIFLTGLFTSNVIGSWVMRQINTLLSRAPLVKSIYGSLLQILQTFTISKNKSFSKVVILTFPSPNTRSIGFITNEEVHLEGSGYASIFVPTTPNPTNGFLLIVPESDYEVLDIPVDQALKMIVSMGTLLPDHLGIKE